MSQTTKPELATQYRNRAAWAAQELIDRLGFPDFTKWGKVVRRRPPLDVQVEGHPEIRFPVQLFTESMSKDDTWLFYEKLLDDYAGGRFDCVETYLRENLKQGAAVIRFVFHHHANVRIVKLSYVAAVFAYLASKRADMTLHTSELGIWAEEGGKPVYGIKEGFVVSRYQKISSPTGHGEAVLRYQPPKGLQAHALLGLYEAAKTDTDTKSLLDCLIWSRSRGVSRLVDNLKISMGLDSQEDEEPEDYSARTPKRTLYETPSQETLTFARYKLRSSPNPRMALKNLLVPSAMTAKEFTIRFGNPYKHRLDMEVERSRILDLLDEYEFEISKGQKDEADRSDRESPVW